ncbi:MAG: hypothetical protein FWC26_04255 [Fibromonadales bacterium]|nr:hypothetical protein [Fibromonadales bacterium]
MLVFALILVSFLGFSIAQDEIPALDALDSAPASVLESEPEPALPPVSEPVPPVPPPVAVPPPAPKPVAPGAIPKGFSSQLQKPEPPPPPPPVEVPAPAKPLVPAPVAAVSSSSVKASSSSYVPYKFYEDYLDSLVAFAKSVLPLKEELETKKAAIKEKGPEPKGPYEKQADYDSRIANFDKNKQKAISTLDKKYDDDKKIQKEKLKLAVHYNPDIQPNWDGMLKQDTNADGYHQRIVKFTEKIASMKIKIEGTIDTLADLELLDKGDFETLDKKNRIYMARLERAVEVMQDYILQDYSKLLSTDKKKFEMAFGDYDPELEQFIVNINDYYSKTVPFYYIGYIQVPPPLAQEIDRKTDNFLASIEYINYPLVMSGQKVYPGATKADIYYKDKLVPTVGGFQTVPGFENLDGYVEWAVHADSLISGTLLPRKLDSLYAMKKDAPKKAASGTWWSRNSGVVGTLFLVAAAGSAGVAIWQNNEAGKKKDDASKWYKGAKQALEDQKPELYNSFAELYDKEVDKVKFHENMRNGFYIGAGVFGVAGILSFCF